MALSYEWMVVKPHIIASEGADDNVELGSVARTLDVESPFSIEPQNGVLEPSGIANFKLTFAPPEVLYMHMFNQGIIDMNRNGNFCKGT